MGGFSVRRPPGGGVAGNVGGPGQPRPQQPVIPGFRIPGLVNTPEMEDAYKALQPPGNAGAPGSLPPGAPPPMPPARGGGGAAIERPQPGMGSGRYVVPGAGGNPAGGAAVGIPAPLPPAADRGAAPAGGPPTPWLPTSSAAPGYSPAGVPAEAPPPAPAPAPAPPPAPANAAPMGNASPQGNAQMQQGAQQPAAPPTTVQTGRRRALQRMA